MKRKFLSVGLNVGLIGLWLLAGCASAPRDDSKQLTAGVVQKEVKPGMSQAEVAEALGSPNIVTHDQDGKETWVYDKMATEASYSQRSGFGTILILGFSRQSGRSSSSQRTLTVVIKFNDKQKVDTFSFHSSKF